MMTMATQEGRAEPTDLPRAGRFRFRRSNVDRLEPAMPVGYDTVDVVEKGLLEGGRDRPAPPRADGYLVHRPERRDLGRRAHKKHLVGQVQHLAGRVYFLQGKP